MKRRPCWFSNRDSSRVPGAGTSDEPLRTSAWKASDFATPPCHWLMSEKRYAEIPYCTGGPNSRYEGRV